MAMKPRHPRYLVIELWPRLRIAVGEVDRRHSHPADLGFQIPRLFVGIVARQATLRFGRRLAAEDGNAVEAFLPMDKAVITHVAQRLDREVFGLHLDFLKASDVRPRRRQPFEQTRQPGVGAVDIESGDAHDGVVPKNGRRRKQINVGGQRLYDPPRVILVKEARC